MIDIIIIIILGKNVFLELFREEDSTRENMKLYL